MPNSRSGICFAGTTRFRRLVKRACLHENSSILACLPDPPDTACCLRLARRPGCQGGWRTLRPPRRSGVPHPFGFGLSKGAGFASNGRHAIPQHPNHLQVTIDRRYQYAIMVSLSRHDSSPARRSLGGGRCPANHEPPPRGPSNCPNSRSSPPSFCTILVQCKPL